MLGIVNTAEVGVILPLQSPLLLATLGPVEYVALVPVVTVQREPPLPPTGEGSVVPSAVPQVGLGLGTGVSIGGTFLTVIADRDVVLVRVENGLVSAVAVITLYITRLQLLMWSVLSALTFIRKYM